MTSEEKDTSNRCKESNFEEWIKQEFKKLEKDYDKLDDLLKHIKLPPS